VLSVASVRSAGGAADYFAGDNYYTAEGSVESSTWGGEGAKSLGLGGQVQKEPFENILIGKLPDGTLVNQVENRTIGIDLTFSMPKSASVLAYVAGDERILTAHLQAVKTTMTWAEKNMAEGRTYERNSNGEPVRTANLTYALFQHDTSRKLDPQGHIHAVVAAITKMADGKWQALHNGALWKGNTTLGSTYHAAFRAEIEKLGFKTELTGKHGQFEILGVPKEVLKEFSQRREEIVAKAKELGISTPQGNDAVVVNTRDKKLNVEDRGALQAEWKDRAAALGFDGKQAVSDARAAVAEQRREGPLSYPSRVGELVSELRGVVGSYMRAADPLATNGLARISLTPTELRTEIAVASAVRILGQREAAFETNQISKTALDLGLKGVTMDRVEQRVAQLTNSGQLVTGVSDRIDGAITHMTTPEHISLERHMLAAIDAGRDQGAEIVPASQAIDRLNAAAGAIKLSGEQLGAASLMLSSGDRTVIVQGVAGAGKSTLIDTTARVAVEEGKKVLGLAIANKVVSQLTEDAGIPAQTISSFINSHISGAMRGEGGKFEASRAQLKDTVLIVDEGSLVGTQQMLNVLTIANRLEVDRLVLIGDKKQLQAIDHGKPFDQAQSHDPTMATLATSQRQRTPEMRMVAHLARQGNFDLALKVLGNSVTSAGNDLREVAADKWLALSPQDRARTPIYTTGHETRAELNERIQQGLKAEGTLTGEGRSVTTIAQIHATREELRYAHTYQPGQTVDVVMNSRPAGLARGSYEVKTVDQGKVILIDARGREIKFDPSKIDPHDRKEPISLSRKDEIKIHTGEQIRWTDNDKDRGIEKSAAAKILEVSADNVRVQTASGDLIDLKPSDRMIDRMGLGYAINMHQAQGMTSDLGIGVLHSSERNLANERLAHVMFTRVRDRIEVVTNDKDQLVRTIKANPGDKSSALETIGAMKLSPENSAPAPVNPGARGAAGNEPPNTPSPEPTPATQRDPPTRQLPVPEKGLDLTL
jgi:conjugative relaxase-like TrwC/TraI family protein